MEEERASPFQILIKSHCGEGTLLRGGRTRRLRRRLLVNLRSRWSLVDMIYFIIAPIYRPVARVRISLSSGISMFARESETRVVRKNRLYFVVRGREYQIIRELD